ncbi:hypothetical protein SNOG_12512 [Parastagonospora nodorum SN15]|uniref:Secreted protein n=1 Tax=Phaeosphaeria nodorum (strain SN15 / ATCC MYA-4574 / FGSC 10173) TaxID=321614 RepID=Q0U6V2_PHANO|nr:hypothetical protein SNOG_12512 [Parastagonospora nodorum SN15]EAT80325.1 hypothetical protein SNOG_12512 [Parastagonospora nodorum SN15]
MNPLWLVFNLVLVIELWYCLCVYSDMGPIPTDRQHHRQGLPQAEAPSVVSKGFSMSAYSFLSLCDHGVVAHRSEPSAARVAKWGRDGAERNTTPPPSMALHLRTIGGVRDTGANRYKQIERQSSASRRKDASMTVMLDRTSAFAFDHEKYCSCSESMSSIEPSTLPSTCPTFSVSRGPSAGTFGLDSRVKPAGRPLP